MPEERKDNVMKNAIKTASIINFTGNTISIGGGIAGGIGIGKAVANVSDSTGLGVAAGIVGGVVIASVGSYATNKITSKTCGKDLITQSKAIINGEIKFKNANQEAYYTNFARAFLNGAGINVPTTDMSEPGVYLKIG